MPKVKLYDVAVECKETIKGETGLPVVGLEHLIPGEVCLTQWSNDSDNTFTKRFRKGQVLFGRRRAYLKKAAVAPFDGICSGDITVIAARADVLEPELLPFIIQNDALFDYAVGHSAGSLSPRVKWEHLKNYEFQLPDRAQQRELARLLWAVEDTRRAYQTLIQRSEELVKSQFVGTFEGESSFPTRKIVDLCTDTDDIKCGPFGTQLKQSEYTQSGVPIWGIPQINAGFSIEPDNYVTVEKAKKLEAFSLRSGDIAMSRKGNVGQCALYPETFEPGIIASDVLRIRTNSEIIDPLFLQQMLHHSESVKRQILLVSDGAVMAGINVTKLKNISVIIPPLSLQKNYAAFVRQLDKSKHSAQKALEDLQATQKALIRKYLG